MRKYLSLFVLFLFSLVAVSENIGNGNGHGVRGNYEEITLLRSINRQGVIEIGESLSEMKWTEILKMGFVNDYDVEVYRIKYWSEHPGRGNVLTSGLIMLPVDTAGNSFPVLSLQHGTVVRKTDSPSSNLNSAEVKTAVLFCSEGFIVLMADYIGMEDFSDIMHPYCQNEALGNSVIDLVRAFRNFSENSTGIEYRDGLFMTGYSEGGYATMSAAKLMHEKYPDEFSITACSPMAGPFDMSDTMVNIMLSGKPYPSPYYLPYVILGFQEVYGFFEETSEIFKYPYSETIPPLFNGKNSGKTISNAMSGSGIPKDILDENFLKQIESRTGKVYEALLDNDVYDWTPSFPIKLVHSVSDDQVPYDNSVKAYNKFVERGVGDVTLVPVIGNKKHTEAAYIAIPIVNLWFKEFLK